MHYPFRALPLRLAVLTVTVASLASIASATDRRVPTVYPTIQQAINASVSGDTVVLEPGSYVENINFNGKNIIIKPFNDNFETTIDGGQAGPVVTFSGAEPPSAGLRKLTIRNGKTSNGGGIKGNNTMATIKNCIIRNNQATSNGGGIYGFTGLIEKCTIMQNKAVNGGGISDCDGTIDSCKIMNNEATTAGGGVYDSPATIQFCEITNNEASTGGGGIASSDGIVLGNLIAANLVTATGPVASPASFGGGLNDMGGTVTMNMVIGNESKGDGGGIASSSAVIHNNVFAENIARRGAGTATCTGEFANNTVWDNAASHFGGGCFNMTNVANTIIYQNSAPADPQISGGNIPTYSCIQGWVGPQPDIITGAPMLNNPTNGKYDLLATSPCIDAGKLIVNMPTDFEGEPRPYDGSPLPVGDGSDFDIGADEYIPANLDLAAVFTTVKAKSKGTIPKLKYSIQAKMTVTNTGTDPTENTALVEFYLSNDNVWDPGDVLTGKIGKVKKLKGGKSKKVNCKAKLPLNTTATGQYLIAVIDPTNVISETNEGNNIIVYGPLP